VLELAQLHVRRFVRAPQIGRAFFTIETLHHAEVGSERSSEGFLRRLGLPNTGAGQPGFLAGPLILEETLIPVDQDRALIGGFDETQAQGGLKNQVQQLN